MTGSLLPEMGYPHYPTNRVLDVFRYSDREDARATNDQYSIDHTEKETPEYEPEGMSFYVPYSEIRAHESEFLQFAKETSEQIEKQSAALKQIKKALRELEGKNKKEGSAR